MRPDRTCCICCCALIGTGIFQKAWSSLESNPWTRRCARCARRPRWKTSRSIGVRTSWTRGPTTREKFRATTSRAAAIRGCICRSIRSSDSRSTKRRDGSNSTRRLPWYRRGSSRYCNGRAPPSARQPRSKSNAAPADFKHVAADEDLAVAVHLEKQSGRPADEFALRDLHLNRQGLLHCQAPGAEIGGGGTGRGILEYRAACREEEPRQRLGLAAQAKNISHAQSVFADYLCHGRWHGRRLAYRIHRGQRHHQLFLAGLDPQRPFADVTKLEAERRRQRITRHIELARCRARRRQGPAASQRTHRDESRLHFQDQRIAAQLQRAANVRRAERGMAGESHFIAGREYSHARVRACLLAGGREDECGLGEVELAGESLHVLITQACAVLEYTERVTGKGALALRENVDDAERVSCHEAIISPARHVLTTVTPPSAERPHHHNRRRGHHRHARAVVSAMIAIGRHDTVRAMIPIGINSLRPRGQAGAVN